MTNTTEAILVDVSEKLGELTAAYVKLEVTTRTETQGMRGDLADMRSLLREVTRTQADLSERLTAGETRIMTLQDDRVATADLRTRLSVLEETVKHITPQKTPWTAIVSSIVALGALAWTLFGK